MLAGLLFAIHDADDRSGSLAATLPFAGMTLIEYQARLLIGAGVSQIVVAVARMTPELLGAVARIGRRGITVDTVRNAGEATAKLHPLSHLLVLADGLVTTEAVVRRFAGDAGDALLVVAEGEATPTDRIGGGLAWAGVARLDARRLTEVAALPRDYDLQAALLRIAGQAGATHVVLPEGELRAGHGVERRGAALEARSRDILSATLAARPGWVDRWIVRPIVRASLPIVMRRAIPSVAVGVTGGVLGAAGLAGLWGGQLTLGLLATIAGALIAGAGAAFAWLRDEASLARAFGVLTAVLPALAALLVGRGVDVERGELTGQVTALALVIAAVLAERAGGDARAPWWGSPVAYLLVVTALVLLGIPLLGLAAAAGYAVATLAAAIEALRRQA